MASAQQLAKSKRMSAWSIQAEDRRRQTEPAAGLRRQRTVAHPQGVPASRPRSAARTRRTPHPTPPRRSPTNPTASAARMASRTVRTHSRRRCAFRRPTQPPARLRWRPELNGHIAARERETPRARLGRRRGAQYASQNVRRPVLAVFGGSFDPPHLGHVLLPTYLLARGLAQRVMIPVSYAHPFGKVQSPFGQRLAWTRAAMRVHGTAVEVSDIEQRLGRARPGPTFTVDVLEAVAKQYPTFAVRLVVGSDLMHDEQYRRWHRWSDIELHFAPIVISRRQDDDEPGALPAISSTQIRSWLAARPDPTAEAKLERNLPAVIWAQLRDEVTPREIVVIGRGHAATRISEWLWSRGFQVTALGAREIAADPSGLQPSSHCAGIWLLTRDTHLFELASRLAAHSQVSRSLPILSGAGARRADDCLAPLATAGHPVGSLHPICSLRREHDPGQLSRAGFGVEGDPAARALALSIVGDQPWLDLQRHDAAARQRYHAACALAANHLAVLYAEANRVLISLGHDPPSTRCCVATLMASALANLTELGVPSGVTGPAARGDEASLQTHLAALDGSARALYEQLSARLQELLRTPS
ncbi:MAG: DUF2520 domain-containing protein [Myxococcales bacterium FL481]|nr:MAG: DUF2520 domain-containing protein [Myxococcales bacterium FL481]